MLGYTVCLFEPLALSKSSRHGMRLIIDRFHFGGLKKCYSGDYVTIYQHQRKVIRERMHEREEAVAKLSFEKERMQVRVHRIEFSP